MHVWTIKFLDTNLRWQQSSDPGKQQRPAHPYMQVCVPFMRRRVGSGAELLPWRQKLEANSTHTATQKPSPAPEVHLPPEHTSDVNRNHVSLDCLCLLSHLLFWCWQGQWLGPVCLSVKVWKVTWVWSFWSPDARKFFILWWRNRTLLIRVCILILILITERAGLGRQAGSLRVVLRAPVAIPPQRFTVPQHRFEVELGLAVQVLHAGGSCAGKEHILLLVPRSRVVDCPATLLI